MSGSIGMIRIIDVPHGEAPESVRKAWVGLIVPVIGPLQKYAVQGVLTGPKTQMGQWIASFTRRQKWEPGYLVDVEVAVSILANSSPEAAEWWRNNTPHMLRDGNAFVFQASVCQEESF